MSKDRDNWIIPGGCWCDPDRKLYTLRIMGHDEKCTEARRGWEANYRHLSEIEQRRRENEAAGEGLRAAAAAALSATEGTE